MRRAFVGCCLVFSLVASDRRALANGRFPRAERLLEASGDPERLVLAATYGLLVTNDRGGDWRHVCELGYAFSIDDIDPLTELLPDGALLVTTAHSLNRAAEPFCAFEPVFGGAGTEAVVDYALDRSAPNRVVAALMQSVNGGIVNALYESSDAGRTFSPLGTPLPASEVAFAVTLDVAPSNPNRIYVSATGRNNPALFLRSDDGGATFTTTALPLDFDEFPYIAAVHPRNPDVVYVRTDFWSLGTEGIDTANDALLFSDDGGRSFRELYRAAGKLLGFALSPDASEVLLGYGDPIEPARSVDAAVLGIYRAETRDHVFSKIFEGPVSCLTWTPTGVYACTSQAQHGFALGFAPSADFELTTLAPLTPLLDLRAVKGPLDCPAACSGAVCRERWQESCTVFGNCDAGAAAVGGGGGSDCSAGAGPGGSGGTPGSAGAAGNGTSGSMGPGSSARESSCGCRAAGAGSVGGSLALGVLAVGLLARRRPRRAPDDAARGRAMRDS